ncbi:hypothetical protein MHB48_19285 [Psychrobacillus sp. FSL H8-0483]|uniref:hypothetical protein n=1 Tax=Psychrobacillus sp. FSL H8-0483 TaxID=2921389 RepID=UPI003159BC69
MKKKLLLVGPLMLIFVLLLFIIPSNYSSILPVFQVTEKPSVISKGTYGNTVTIDLTFGKEEIETLLNSLEAPYPQFFMSIEWIERSETILELMKEKHMPIGLLGQEGSNYIENPDLFKKEIERFERAIGEKPLWFRTKDYEFPMELQQSAWQEEVNLLGSSKYWGKGNLVLEKGDILSVPMHQEEKVEINQLTKFLKSQPFITIEQNLFALNMKKKSYPE